MSQFICKYYVYRFCKDLHRIFEDIKKFSLFCNNFEYERLSFTFILWYLVNICENIFMKVIQYIIFEDLHINIANTNSPTIIYEDSTLVFRLGMIRTGLAQDDHFSTHFSELNSNLNRITILNSSWIGIWIGLLFRIVAE